MPEPTEVNWEVDVKKRIVKVEIDVSSLTVTLTSEKPAEIVKSGKITEADFEKIKVIVEKILTEG